MNHAGPHLIIDSMSFPKHVPPWTYMAVVCAVFLAAYASDVGQAFIKEDANWVTRSRIEKPSDVLRVLSETGGFFRPVVALSFAVNFWMFGGQPLGYGWTNLLLALGVAVAIYRFARSLDLAKSLAILVASLWLLNFHGINMAVLWLSGRTALLLVLFAVLAATEATQNRFVSAAIFAFLAMASKEEGILLPVILLAVVWLRPVGPPSGARLAGFAAALLGVLACYGALRMGSDAYTPSSAPSFYTFTASPDVLAKNVLQYADRAASLSAAVVLLVFAIVRKRPNFVPGDLNLLLLAGIWLVAGYALTVLLPVRSSLYALFPSVGAALAAATMVGIGLRAMSARQQGALAVAALVIPLTLVPIYRLRNQRWTELAEVSSATVKAFSERAAAARSPWHVVIVDDRSTRANVAAAVGWALPDTVELATGKRPRVWIIPPPPDLSSAEWVDAPRSADAVLALRDRRVIPLPQITSRPAKAGEFW